MVSKVLGIKLQGDFANIMINNDHMLVGSGVLDNYLSKFCYQKVFQVMNFYTQYLVQLVEIYL